MRGRPEDRCAKRIRALYGDDLLSSAGALHVTSVWSGAGGRLFTLRIGPACPRSATDSFVLELTRARADAIVTTGQILRDEPGLRTELEDPELVAWRRERLGKSEAPLTVVLSRRTDLEHPLLAAPDAVVRHAGLRETLAWLREERGATTVAIEAGPSTTRALYDEPLAVDELLLSICHLPALPAGVQGGELGDLAHLTSRFPRRSERTREEESGAWSFLRLHS